MQCSGFRSVIGSMWSVDDDVAAQLVCAFYGNMFDGQGRSDYTYAAVSLREEISLELIVFIHIGT